MPRPKNLDSSLEDSILSQMGEEKDKTEQEEEEIEEDEGEEEEEEGAGEEEEESDVVPGEEEEDEEPGTESDDLLNLKVKPDKKGNLIDPKTNKIVAASGQARRFYEELRSYKNRYAKLERAYGEVRRLNGQAGQALAQLKAHIVEAQRAPGIAKQLGLTDDEHAEALNFMAKFKNPATTVDAIKYVLTRAAQRGIKMEGLSEGTLDISTITNDVLKKIEETVGPIKDRLKASDDQEELRRRVDTEIQEFLNDPVEGEVKRKFLPVLVRMAQRPELAHLSLNESWLVLQNYLLRQRRQPSKDTKSRLSRPGGRKSPGPERSDQIDDSPVGADVSFKDIVRSVVKDYGGIDQT
ncbi:MAG: hypothetical protein MN733_03465 [Nitrososphaera sp.]|nr:hypothetical protein [Nitrososphaera sp.]